MRRSFMAATAAIVALAATGIPDRAAARQQPEIDIYTYINFLNQFIESARASQVIHPVQLALQEWERLQLSESQVDSLNHIERQMTQSFMAEMGPSGPAGPPAFDIMWSAIDPDSADVRASVAEQVDSQFRLLAVLLKARDDVFEVLGAEKTAALREIAERRASGADPVARNSMMSRGCTRGSMGGGSSVGRGIQLVFSLTLGPDSATIDGLFVGRAEGRVARNLGPATRPERPDSLRLSGGGSMGRWMVAVDRTREIAWIHDEPVPLDGANVILLDGFDRLNGKPTIAAMETIPPTFHTGGCADGQRVADKLLSYVLEFPSIRAFIER